MQEAMVGEIGKAAVAAKGHVAHQMPLAFLDPGESALIVKVRGNDEMHHHLENLGFVTGATVHVVSKNGGNVIAEVKGSQVALDRSVASKIIAG